MKQQAKITQWLASFKKRWSGRNIAATLAATLLLGTLGTAQAQTVTKSMSPNVVLSNGTMQTTMTITVTNTSGVLTRSEIALTDNMSANTIGLAANGALSVSSTNIGAGAPPSCGTVLGASNSLLTGATVLEIGGIGTSMPPLTSCTYNIGLTATSAGSFNNTIAAGSPLFTNGGTVLGAASASFTVIDPSTLRPPVVSKSVGSTALTVGDSTTYTVSLTNQDAVAMTNAGFTDIVPTGLTPTAGNASTTCASGAVNISGQTVTLSGAILAASSTCTVTFSVLATTANPNPGYQNALAIGAVTATDGAGNAQSNTAVIPAARVRVSLVSQSILAKSFSPSTVDSGGISTVTLQITNTESVPWNNVRVTDVLPANMSFVDDGTVGTSSTCSGATRTSTVLTGTQVFSIPTIAEGEVCTVKFNVTVTAATLVYTNSISANSMTRDNGASVIPNQAASAVLTISAIPSPGDSNPSSLIKALRYPKAFTATYGDPALPDMQPGQVFAMQFSFSRETVASDKKFKIADTWASSFPDLRLLGGLEATSIQATPSTTRCYIGSGVNPANYFVADATSFVIPDLVMPTGVGVCTFSVWMKVIDDSSTAPAPQPVNNPTGGNIVSNTVLACPGVGLADTTTYTTDPSDCDGRNVWPATWTAEEFAAIPLSVAKQVGSSTFDAASYAATRNVAVNTEFSYKLTFTSSSPDIETITVTDTLPDGVTVNTGDLTAVSQVACYAKNHVNAITTTVVTPGGYSVTGAADGKTLTWTVNDLPGLGATSTALRPYCELYVKANAVGPYTLVQAINTLDVGDADVAGSPELSNTASSLQAIVVFDPPITAPVVSKQFSAAQIIKDDGDAAVDTIGSYSERATLTIGVTNSATSTSLTNIGVTDNMDTDGGTAVLAYDPATFSSTCATLTSSSAREIKFNITGPLGFNQTCNATIQVYGTDVGTEINEIAASSLTSDQGVTNASATTTTLSVLATDPIVTLYKDVTQAGSSIHGGTIGAGTDVVYEFTLKNTGLVPASLANYVGTVTDALPVDLTYVSATAIDGVAASNSGQNVTWDLSSSSKILASGETLTFSITATVSPTALGVISNVGKTSVSGSCAAPTAYSNNLCGTLGATPISLSCTMPALDAMTLDPSVSDVANANMCQPVSFKAASQKYDFTKSVDVGHNTAADPGDTLTYTINITNTGTGILSMSSVVKSVTDTAPTGTTIVAGSASSGGVVAGNTVTWDLAAEPTLAVGATRAFTFRVKLDNPNTQTLLSNSAISDTLSSCAITGNAANDAACLSTPPVAACTAPVNPQSLTAAEIADANICKPVVTPVNQPTFTIAKDVFKVSDVNTSINAQSVVAGDELLYKITVTNSGTADVHVKDLVKTISDAIPTGTTFVAGSTTPTASTLPGAAAIWDLTSSADVILEGEKRDFTFKVTVNNDATGTIANTGVVNGVDTNITTNPVAQVPHTITKKIYKTGDTTATSIDTQTVAAGDALTYELTLTNTGVGNLSLKSAVLNIVDDLPAGLTYVASSDSGSAAGQVVTWDFTTLATDVVLSAGQTKTVTVDVTVDNTASGTLMNNALTGSGKTSNNVVNPVEAPAHTVTKSVYKTGDTAQTSLNGQTVAAGDLLTYGITVTNSGKGNLSVADFVKTISDKLPAGLTVVTVNDAGSASGQDVAWDLSNSTQVLKTGETVFVSVDVKVNDDATGSLKNMAKTITQTSNEVINSITPPKHALLKDVRKKGSTESANGVDVIGGDELTYVLTLKNTGSGNLSLKDFVKQVSDAVPTGTTVTTVGSGGVNDNGTIVWDLSSDAQVLGVGASREFTFDVRVDESATQPIANVAKTTVVSSCPINDSTCLNNPPVPACSMPANVLNLTSSEQADASVCKPVVNNLILDTTLFLEKTVDRKQAELGDMVKYTIRVKNAGKARATAVQVSDTLPAGFRYIENTTRLADGTAMAEPVGAPGPTLTFSLGNIAAGAEITFTYRVRIGVGAMEGDGTNRATACTTANKILCSNEGRAKVVVQGGVFTDKACLMGTAFADLNDNAVKDENETGVPGVRLYMEDGTYFITDTTGKYSYCGIEPRTHVLKVDKTSLPRGSQLIETSNRNMGDANSLFLDVKNGELHRGDIAIKPLSEQFMKDVERRIKGQGDEPAKGVVFEGVAK